MCPLSASSLSQADIQTVLSFQVMVSGKSDADSAALKKVGLTLYFMTSMAVLMMNM